MSSTEASPRVPAWGRAVIVLFLALAAGAWMEARLRGQLLQERRDQVFAELVPYGRSLSVSVTRRLNKVEALHGYALKGLSPNGTLTEEDFESFASGLLVSLSGVKMVSIAPVGVQSFVYPLELNPEEVGRNLLDSPSPGERELLELAMESDQSVMGSPEVGADGVTRLVARRAVHRGEEFLGLVSIVFEESPLLAEAGLLPPPGHMNFLVRDDSELTVHGDAQLLGKDPVAYRFDCAQGEWQLLAAPAGGWAAFIAPTIIAYRIGAGAIALLLALITYMISSLHRRLSEEIRRGTRELSEANEALHVRVREREAAEAALHESESRLSRTEKFSLVMSLHLSLEGIWLKVPPTFCEFLGYSADELIGHHLSEATHPDDIQVDGEQFERLLNGETMTSDMEKRFIHKDGRTVWAYVNRSVVSDEDGNPLYFLVYLRDITREKAAREALKESEERYRSLVTAMTSIVWTTDPEGRLATRQDSWEAYTGQTREAYEGYGWVEVIHPDDRERLQAQWEHSVKSGELYEIEARIWNREKAEYRQTQVRAAPVYDEEGAIREWIGTVTDVHDRRLAEAALQESQERYRRIVETAGEGIWLVDREWNTSFVNARMCEMLGYSGEELIGRNVLEFTQLKGVESFRERMREREAGNGEVYEFTFLRKDGSELCALLSTSPLTDEEGAFVGSLAMVTDITERVRAEQTLKESERRLTTLMGNLPGMAYRCQIDAHWTLEFVSEGCEALTGHPAEKMTGNPDLTFVTLIHPDDLHYMSSNVAMALRNRDVFRLEYRIFAADGTQKWVWEQGQGVFSSEGKLEALEGFITDITERKEADEEIRRLNEELESRVVRRTEQLQQANRELEAFSYSVSHDLRAPLRGIDGFARILEDEYAPVLPPDGQRYLGLVRNNAQQMGRLIDDLLNFSRMNRQPVKRVQLNPTALVKECLTPIRAAENGRSLEVSVGDLPDLEGDPALLRQVFINLLSNAIKFTRHQEPARIEVGAYEDESRGTVFFVRDNGVGFDMKYRDKLFGVFQRLHRAEEYEGTGVGLALIQRIIHRHNGEIWAEAAPGEGATFYFTLGEDEPDE